MSGRYTTPTSQAQHVRQAAREDANRPGETPKPGGIRHGRERTGKVLDLHEVGANRSDSLEVLRDLVHGVGQSAVATPVELLGEKDVLRDLYRVFQQPMDEDDVDTDQLSPAPDPLSRDLTDVRDDFSFRSTAWAHARPDSIPRS